MLVFLSLRAERPWFQGARAPKCDRCRKSAWDTASYLMPESKGT